MRKIEKEMLQAIATGRNYNNSNTSVICVNGCIFVQLYNTIIYAKVNGKEYFSDGGFCTITTGSRLRALGANYSTNEKKNGCILTPAREMRTLYFAAKYNS